MDDERSAPSRRDSLCRDGVLPFLNDFDSLDVRILECRSGYEALNALRAEILRREGIFPKKADAKIVVKPNLNSDLDSLTGNTTDLRVLAATLRLLKERGYINVTVADGPNGGFHRYGVDVFGRNRVDRLAGLFGYRTLDVNRTVSSTTVRLQGSGEAQIAEIFCDSDLFINLPKLKTHCETLMSVALKSLMGILVGQANKAKAHASLVENILRLNDQVRPHLYVVDGLMAMEGTGPSAGRPVRTNMVMVGTDPYEIDLVAAKVAGFSTQELPLIQRALGTGRIGENLVRKVASLRLNGLEANFAPPKPGILARLVVAPSLNRIVRTLRNSTPVDRLLRSERVRKWLLAAGLTQEVILRRERQTTIRYDPSRCRGCKKCARYCPLLRELPKARAEGDGECLDCLYCYAVCPTGAIRLEGDVGYYRQQQKRYGEIIKQVS